MFQGIRALIIGISFDDLPFTLLNILAYLFVFCYLHIFYIAILEVIS